MDAKQDELPAGPEPEAWLPSPVVLFPAVRTAGTRHVVRRARLVAEPGVLTLHTMDGTYRLTVGGGGLAAAVHVAPGCTAEAEVLAARPGRYQELPFFDRFGCVHFCDAAGRSLVCLALADWMPDSGAVAVTPDVGLDPDAAFLAGGFAELCRCLGVPVHRAGQAPPPGQEGPGQVRPGPSAAAAATSSPLLLPLGGVGGLVFVAAVAAYVVRRGEPLGGVDLRWLMVATGLGLLVLAADLWTRPLRVRRREGALPAADAVLRPRPSVPASRRFRSATRLAMSGRQIVVTSASGTEAWLGGPSQPVGVTEFVPLRDPAERGLWGMALADPKGAFALVLPYQDWFGADPDLAGLRRFAAATGMRVRGLPVPATRDGVTLPWSAGTDVAWTHDLRQGPATTDLVRVSGLAALHGLIGLGFLPLALAGWTGVAVTGGGALLRFGYRALYYDRQLPG